MYRSRILDPKFSGFHVYIFICLRFLPLLLCFPILYWTLPLLKRCIPAFRNPFNQKEPLKYLSGLREPPLKMMISTTQDTLVWWTVGRMLLTLLGHWEELPPLQIPKMINGVSGDLSERQRLLIAQGTPSSFWRNPGWETLVYYQTRSEAKSSTSCRKGFEHFPPLWWSTVIRIN